MTHKVLNSPTIRRMPSYLHWLLRMKRIGKKYVASAELAEYMKIRWIVVRKDIALTGIPGQRRVGYEINALIEAIREYLGWTNQLRATLIGAGSLGTALLGYEEFHQFGLCIESVFDSDTNKIGKIVRDREILDIAKISTVLKKEKPEIGIICTSAATAQIAADQLVRLGIRYIWNFANVTLNVPPDVIVQREVIAGGFAMLAVKIKNDKLGRKSDELEE